MDLFAFLVALVALGVSGGTMALTRAARDRAQTAVELPEGLARRVGELELLLEDYKAHRDFFEKALEELATAVDENSSELQDHTKAIAEGIEHVDRSERRVRAAVRRAEKRLEEAGYVDPALEGEVEGLRRLDAEERGAEGMHAVSADVEPGPAYDYSDLPGEW